MSLISWNSLGLWEAESQNSHCPEQFATCATTQQGGHLHHNSLLCHIQDLKFMCCSALQPFLLFFSLAGLFWELHLHCFHRAVSAVPDWKLLACQEVSVSLIHTCLQLAWVNKFLIHSLVNCLETVFPLKNVFIVTRGLVDKSQAHPGRSNTLPWSYQPLNWVKKWTSCTLLQAWLKSQTASSLHLNPS